MIRVLTRSAQAACPVVREFYFSWAHPLFDQGRLQFAPHGNNYTLVDETFFPLQLASTHPRTYNSTTATVRRPHFRLHPAPTGPHSMAIDFPFSTARETTKNIAATARRPVRKTEEGQRATAGPCWPLPVITLIERTLGFSAIHCLEARL